MATKKQEQLNQLLADFKETYRAAQQEVSYEEVAVFFQKMTELIKKTRQQMAQDMSTIMGVSAEEAEKLATKHDESLRTLKAAMTKALESLTADQRAGMGLITDKINRFDKKLDEREGRIVSLIPEVPDFELETPEQTRDKLESLTGNERLSYKAIGGLNEKLEELKSTKVGGGGGTSQASLKFALSKMLTAETPTGDIDGVNKEYTTAGPIQNVISFAINGQVITDDEYTFSKNVITMTSAIPAGLSGTSFRITYV